MLSCAMLMPSRSERSLVAHLSWRIVARKSAMMRSVGASSTGGSPIAPVPGEMVRVT